MVLLFAFSTATADNFDFTGHTKLNATVQTYPDDSFFRSLLGTESFDGQADLRLNLKWRSDGWAFDADYQLVFLHGDSLDLGSNLPPALGNFFNRLPNDDRRLFDLTDVISDSGDNALLHRLDRLFVVGRHLQPSKIIDMPRPLKFVLHNQALNRDIFDFPVSALALACPSKVCRMPFLPSVAPFCVNGPP